MSFPSSPSLNQTHEIGSNRYYWSGSAWMISREGVIGYTGPTGDIGARSDLSYDGAPIGTVMAWSSTSLPTGQWAWCDGSQLSQATYSSLYVIISTNYNTGGETAGNFRLPDLRDRAPKGRATMTSGSLSTNTRSNATGNEGSHTHSAANWSLNFGNINSNSGGSHRHYAGWYHGATYNIGGPNANSTHRNGNTGNNGPNHSNAGHVHSNTGIGANAETANVATSESGGHGHDTNAWASNYSRNATAAPNAAHSHASGFLFQSVNYIIRIS
jgi:microcystin-dependent protein